MLCTTQHTIHDTDPHRKIYTSCGTRTRNLRIRGPTPCPLGQGGLAFGVKLIVHLVHAPPPVVQHSVHRLRIPRCGNGRIAMRCSRPLSSSGVAQWLACWAHNPKVRGSKPRSAIVHSCQLCCKYAAMQLYRRRHGAANVQVG